MTLKFENLKVWQDAVAYVDKIYDVAQHLPRIEDFNLRSQIIRAATSIALNIAEGSTGQTDMEQSRFIGLAIRSAVETVACIHLIRRRAYVQDAPMLEDAYAAAQSLISRLQAFRRAIEPQRRWLREDVEEYLTALEQEEERRSST